jgi:hypothetical protein
MQAEMQGLSLVVTDRGELLYVEQRCAAGRERERERETRRARGG